MHFLFTIGVSPIPDLMQTNILHLFAMLFGKMQYEFKWKPVIFSKHLRQSAHFTSNKEWNAFNCLNMSPLTCFCVIKNLILIVMLRSPFTERYSVKLSNQTLRDYFCIVWKLFPYECGIPESWPKVANAEIFRKLLDWRTNRYWKW